MIRRIGIDLGTSNVRIYVPQKGIFVNEPSVAAIDATTQKVIEVGEKAKQMLGRTPEAIIASNPLNDGVIASYKITRQILQIYLNRILGRFRLFKPEIIINVPVGATSTEKKAVLDAIESVGAKKVYLIKAPIAAALGAGIDISSSSGNIVIDVGGGKTEIAVISLGDIVAYTSVRYGGKKMDDAIIDYTRKKYNLVIGGQTAEAVKIGIGSALPLKKDLKEEVSGSNTISGLPESIIIQTSDIAQAVKPVLNEIVLAVKQVLQKTPPELSSDVMDKGIVITGGGIRLRNFDNMLTKITGVPCQIAEEPQLCTIMGIKIASDNFDEFVNSLIWKS
jgi:rod shape-determining protein MreB